MSTRYFILFFSCLTLFSFSQKLDKATKKYLRLKMDSIGKIDQKYRWHLTWRVKEERQVDSLKKLSSRKLEEYEKKVHRDEIGFDNKTRDSIWKIQKRLDSLNAVALIDIISEYGYPSLKRTGSFTTVALSLHLLGGWYYPVLQPIFWKELEKGNMPADEYARWYDRTQLVSGKKQLYGEYDKRFPCVEDRAKTNLERKKIGLKAIKKNTCR